jgi:hypothetical protein
MFWFWFKQLHIFTASEFLKELRILSIASRLKTLPFIDEFVFASLDYLGLNVDKLLIDIFALFAFEGAIRI